MSLTQERLKEVFKYDPESGIFTRIKVTGKRTKVGQHPTSVSSSGYRVFMVDGRHLYCHRAAFLYMNGKIPKVVDHINGNPLDNRWGNLREATPSGNAQNSKTPKSNKSGVRCVYWNKFYKKWHVQVTVNSKSIHLGYWDDLEAAELLSILAREKYHKEFVKY